MFSVYQEPKVIKNFITKEYCDEIRKISKPHLKSSSVSSCDTIDETLRKSKSVGLVDEFIITELARWGRNMLEALQNINILKKHKCNLVVLKENIDLNSASGNLLTNILFSLAEWERQECKIRTAKVLQDLKANNKQYTKSVYGYDMVNGDMIENPTEIRMLKKVAKLKSNGKSYQEITDFLNRNGYVRKNKTIWNRNSIIKLIKTRIKNDNSISINQ